MSPRRILLIAALLAAPSGALRAQSLEAFPAFNLTTVVDHPLIRAYGSVMPDPLTQVAAYVWSLGNVSLAGAEVVTDASEDGLTLAGTWNGFATRRGSSGVWDLLPDPSGSFFGWRTTGISDAGSLVVGSAPFFSAIEPRLACRWDEGLGSVGLSEVFLYWSSDALCVAGDGSSIGGARQYFPGEVFQACLWPSTGTPVGMIPGTWPGATTTSSATHVLDQDGTRAAGTFGNEAWIWNATDGASLIPRPAGLPSNHAMIPAGLTDDGKMMVGRAGFITSVQGWLWTPLAGTRLLTDVAAQLRIDTGALTQPLGNVQDCTGDGRFVGGRHGFPDHTDSWRLNLPAGGVGQVIDLGQLLPGSTKPKLEIFGSLAGSTLLTAVIDDLTPLTTATMVVGFSRLDLPFKGGVLVPNPDLLISVPTLLGGPIELPSEWPQGVPSGASTFVQVWVPSAGGPAGLAASNALELITP
jgi:hypothetical protein